MAETPARNVRIPDADWQRLDEIARAAGTNRSRLLQDLIRQYVSGVITSPLLPRVPPATEAAGE